MPTRPMKIKPCSSFSGSRCSGSASSSLMPKASTRSAFSPMVRFALRTCCRRSPFMGRISSLMKMRSHRSSSTSGAPLVMNRKIFPNGWTVVMSLRPESKGISATRGCLPSLLSLWYPLPSANSTSAVSVGSPTQTVTPASAGEDRESLHSMNPSMNSSWPGSLPSKVATGSSVPFMYTSLTVMRFWVSVPVLSEQMICVLPRVSTAASLRMMALRRAIFCTPWPRTMVTSAGILREGGTA